MGRLQVLKLIDELEQSGQMSPAAINEHEGDTFGEHELGIWCSLSLASGGHADGGDLYWARSIRFPPVRSTAVQHQRSA